MTIDRTPLDAWIAATIGQPGPLRRPDLERYQLERLRETIRLARARSPFYQRHLAHVEGEITALPDLARLPFTTPADLRERALQLLCVSQDEIARIVTLDSSGTTGEPKRIAFTEADQELTLDFFQAGMSTFTASGDAVLILLPAERPGSVGMLLAKALPRIGARGIPHGPTTNLRMLCSLIEAEHVNIIVGTPTQVLTLAQHPIGQTLSLKSVLLTADHVPHAIVRTVERAWGCRVYSHYGMTEMGLGGGVECQARHGYHMREADLLIEIVDPSSGQPAPDGQLGEIVFTTLTRVGMPLIRYRTGDLSRILTAPCICGTELLTLERVTRRMGGILQIGEAGQLAIDDLDEALFALPDVANFTATLASAGRDQLLIKVALSAAAGDRRDQISAIETVLDTIATIRMARQAGQLDLVVSIDGLAQGVAPPRAKRAISDLRGRAQPGLLGS